MINNIFTKTRIKILLTVLIGFLAVKTAAPRIFLADSPRVSPEFIARLQNAPRDIGVLPEKMIAGLSNLNPFKRRPQSLSGELADVAVVTPPPNVIFKTISKGVSAAEDPTTGQTYIQVQAGTKYRIAGTVTINGVEYPKIEFVE